MMDGGRRRQQVSGNGSAASYIHQSGGACEREFPLRETCSVVLPAMSIILGVMPLLAYYLPVTPHTDIPWWQGLTYQINPLSFQDSNADGIGDIQGITNRLDYLENLGVKAVLLNSIYKSAKKNMGYDVIDHTAIDPVLGTMTDFEGLVQDLHRRDMKLIIDFIPNHTSDQHPWFQKSCQQESSAYKDYYIWSDGRIENDTTRAPPNNWESVYGGSAWTWDESRQQYYFHQHSTHQPDLNMRNPAVLQDIMNVLHFWLDKGVDGFRVVAADYLFEVEDTNLDEVRDEEITQIHAQRQHTCRNPHNHNITNQCRHLFDEYKKKTGKHIYLTVDTMGVYDDHWAQYYTSGVDQPRNLGLASEMKRRCAGKCLQKHVQSVLSMVPDGKLASWVLGSPDVKRMTTRKGMKYIAVMNMLLLCLPGSPTVYYGDELGMSDVTVSKNEAAKLQKLGLHVDGEQHASQAPMQWNSYQNAGFSTVTQTWLPVHPDYLHNNVEVQLKDPNSLLSQFQRLAFLRQHEPALQWGKLVHIHSDNNVYAFTRTTRGRLYNKYLIILNSGDQNFEGNFAEHPNAEFKIPKEAKVVFHTGNFGSNIDKKFEDKISTNGITLSPGQGLVLEY